MVCLTVHSIVDIIVNAGLSERKLGTIVQNLKTKWGPKIINVNVKNALAMRKKGLNKFFSVVKQTYEDKGDYVPRTATVCHDLGNFYKFVCQKKV